MCALEFWQQQDPFSFRRNYSRQKQSRSFLPCFSSQSRHFTWSSAYFGDQGAWRLETAAVIVFALFGILGLRLSVVLVIGYCLHGIWDVVHEVHAYCGVSSFGAHELTELPLAYGAFCAAFDWCVAGYFYTRRREWNAAWKAHTRG